MQTKTISFILLFLFAAYFCKAEYNLQNEVFSEFPDSIISIKSEIGNSTYGRNNYIEYIQGTMPIVISIPHGGYDKPEEIKDRELGTSHHDIKTLEIGLLIQKIFNEKIGRYPYLIINRLHRVKLDPNREITIASQGDLLAKVSYNDFHNFIEAALKDVENKWQKGLYIDLHAHNHETQLIEMGYLLESGILANSDSDLNDDLYIDKSSLRNLVRESSFAFSEIIHGDVSFGSLLSKYGYSVVPSTLIPDPKSDYFFSGGYNTQKYGPDRSDAFNSLQIELPWKNVRDSNENILKISHAIVEVLFQFMKLHYKIDLNNLD